MFSLLISIVIALVLAGIALWLLDFITMDATLRRLIHGLVIIVAVLYCLFVLGTAIGHPVHLVTP